ncbi:hypothetical protein [Segatella baroniae]|uniref:hypothetical protein n=1 Tax=Segatella baroniae TaxID=305719 RepID=UPI001EE1918E|nr:hypothetical protein [Segatella baroniae]
MEEDYNSRLNKMQKEEYLIKNACYSVTKYYLCKQNNKRSLLGRKQRNQVTRSFLNRYQFSSTNKVTSLFSTSCILRIILYHQKDCFDHAKGLLRAAERATTTNTALYDYFPNALQSGLNGSPDNSHGALR